MPKATAELFTAMNGLKKDEVLRLKPDPGKSLRGLKTSAGRVVKSNGLKIEWWADQAEEYLFVRKV